MPDGRGARGLHARLVIPSSWSLPALVLALALAAGGARASAQSVAASPYAGQEQREIKALSAQDIAELLAGRGWGFALPAELNGYPGPAHLLELADRLGLSDEQRARVRAVHERMTAEARALGARFVEAERALDLAFASGRVERGELSRLVADSEAIRSAMRLAHLAAHLQVRPLLDRHQLMAYARLRGYDGAHGQHGRH